MDTIFRSLYRGDTKLKVSTTAAYSYDTGVIRSMNLSSDFSQIQFPGSGFGTSVTEQIIQSLCDSNATVLVLVGPAAVFSVECVNCTQTSFTKLVNVSAVVFRDAGRNVPLPCAPCVPVHPHFIYFAHHLPVFRIAILSSVFSTSIMA
jgi:hypothetical protein